MSTQTTFLTGVGGWLRQTSTKGGIAAIAGTLTAVSQGQMDWETATPLIVASIVAMILPFNRAGSVDPTASNGARPDQVVIKERMAVAEPPGQPFGALAQYMDARDAVLSEQITALARAVAALSRPPEAPPAPKAGALAMFDKALPNAGEIAAEVVRLQEALRPSPAKHRPAAAKPKPAASKALASMDTVDVMARTIFGEARGEGLVGMEAVASVIMNRAKHPRWWGNDVKECCLKPRQFSCWNDDDPQYTRIRSVTESDAKFVVALDVARRATSGKIEDKTGGADHYVNLKVANPSWARHQPPSAIIGAHTFFRLELDAPDILASQEPIV